MNAMIGDAGEASASGTNVNNPYFTQFFKMSAIPAPASIFVFLDELPRTSTDKVAYQTLLRATEAPTAELVRSGSPGS